MRAVCTAEWLVKTCQDSETGCPLSRRARRRSLSFRVLGAQSLRRLPPDVAVVKTTHTRQFDSRPVPFGRPLLESLAAECVETNPEHFESAGKLT
jgi:hypothetical protein